jgi:murein L,D-transpeptidase YafK
MAKAERFELPSSLAHLTPRGEIPVWSAAWPWKPALKIGFAVFVGTALLALVPWVSTNVAGLRVSFVDPPHAGGVAVANAASRQSADATAARAVARAPTTHTEAEAHLFEAVLALRAGQLARAELSVETLLEKYPNYQLAHLLRADILQARSGRLKGIGGGATPSPQLAGLIKELEARVGKFSEPAIDGRRPDMFIQLAQEVRFALAVDVSRSRLYVLENGPMGPRRVFDVYATIGASGSGKLKEGDKRTPLGVYTLLNALDRTKLPDFYGDGAFPLDYPNVLDKRAGRDGYGIWLHGVSKDNFVRPPQSSDGCIVVSNADLKLLTPFVQAGKTQIAIANTIRWVPTTHVAEGELALRKTIEQWRQDWESRSHEKYMKHYASDFFSDKIGNVSEWRESRRSVTEQKSSVSVNIENLTIAHVPNHGETMMVVFDQKYKSEAADTKLRKRQYWQREGTRWKIIYEGNV